VSSDRELRDVLRAALDLFDDELMTIAAAANHRLSAERANARHIPSEG
jgi:hypothetical protein